LWNDPFLDFIPPLVPPPCSQSFFAFFITPDGSHLLDPFYHSGSPFGFFFRLVLVRYPFPHLLRFSFSAARQALIFFPPFFPLPPFFSFLGDWAVWLYPPSIFPFYADFSPPPYKLSSTFFQSFPVYLFSENTLVPAFFTPPHTHGVSKVFPYLVSWVFRASCPFCFFSWKFFAVFSFFLPFPVPIALSQSPLPALFFSRGPFQKKLPTC